MAEEESRREQRKWLDHFRTKKDLSGEGGAVDDVIEPVEGDGCVQSTSEESPEARLTRENAELRDKFIRTLAELDNTRKRFSDERERALRYAIAGFVKDLINVMEDFYLAMASVSGKEKSEDLKVFYGGIELIFGEMKKAFEKNNVRRIYPLNEQFNPDYHEAIGGIENSSSAAGTIVEVMQAGYTLNGRVLKPALVAVAK
ncbi:MAG: nucleotide exchange factor GrpE [Rickettsiales bacterium]|jgi:molecular chaperone GrpE|nr:nucleotide exchange factor GrpE [Rickettsiales bacterium]